MTSAGGRAIESEGRAAQERGDFNTAVMVEALLGSLLRYEAPCEAFDEEVTWCPACGSHEADCNTREAWCDDCAWHFPASSAPFVHGLVYEAHLRRRARIEQLLKAAGVLPEHW